MPDEKHDQERADRDRERSQDARWRVAEAGAEDERQAHEQDDSENEAGGSSRKPEHAPEQGGA